MAGYSVKEGGKAGNKTVVIIRTPPSQITRRSVQARMEFYWQVTVALQPAG